MMQNPKKDAFLEARPRDGRATLLVWFSGLLFVILLIGGPIVSVPAGHSGVVDLFGHVYKETLPSGLNFKMPYSSAYHISLKTQLIETSLNVPTNEGLIVELDVSILFRIQPEMVRKVYLTMGVNYKDVLLMPEITSMIRSLTSSVVAKTLYSSGRNELSDGIKKQLNERLEGRGFVIEQALLRKVVLPALVTTAIEEKLKAEQESQRMEFVLTKEKQEAERKRIEAQGISDFQKIVSMGISEQLLEWKGIEATEKLAASHNAKIVIVGSQKNGLPLILGDHSSMSSGATSSQNDNKKLQGL